MRNCAALTVILALCAASASPAEASTAHATPRTLKVHVKAVTTNFIDNAPTGSIGPGDELLLSEVATRAGVTVGHTVVVEIIVNDMGESEQSFTLSLASGDISYTGMGRVAGTEMSQQGTSGTFAIVGGTGRYSGARGFVVAKATDPAGLEHDLTFHLR